MWSFTTPACACLPPFEQLIGQQMVQLQDSILEHLDHHTHFNMLSDRISEAHHAWILSCSSPGVGAWFITRQIFLAFQLSSPVFSTTLHTQLGLPHPSIVGIFRCVCTHPINPINIHFLCCGHGNKRIGTHDAFCDTFVTIGWNVGFHMGQKQLHALPSTTFNSFRQRVDIVFTKDGVCTLADLLPWSCTIQGFAAFNATQTKERSYCNWHPIDQFLPLAIEVFGCLHKHVDMFLHDCANAIWSLKEPKGPQPFYLDHFFFVKIFWSHYKGCKHPPSLNWAIAVSLATSWLPPLQDTPPITTFNLLQVVGFWHINMTDLPQVVDYRHG
jgi:hypothetical protein